MDNFPFSSDDNQPNPYVQRRLVRFKNDLKSLRPNEMVRKHVLMGDCYILNHDEKYDLCSKVSDHFQIRPEQVFIVGSGQLGFSVVDSKRYRPFSADSDIDVALISTELFDRLWVEVLRYDAKAQEWHEEKKKFRRYLMNGWIRPDALPKAEHFPKTREWWAFFKSLSGATQEGRFRINAGLYRTADFLEMYQERAVAGCKTAMELEA